MSDAASHTALEDAQGLGLGIFLSALGLHVLTHAGLMTGQTAGVAVILSHLTGYGFGPVFFAVNLPFYALAWSRLGPVFAAKSLISVTALSMLVIVLPYGLSIGHLNTALAALIFGSLTGLGLLATFRHGGSLGGLGVLALMAQDRWGWKAGYVQLAADTVIFGIALFLFSPATVTFSLLGALVLNLIIAVNHRRDRYIAT